jgi:hypothetical protein
MRANCAVTTADSAASAARLAERCRPLVRVALTRAELWRSCAPTLCGAASHCSSFLRESNVLADRSPNPGDLIGVDNATNEERARSCPVNYEVLRLEIPRCAR